MRSLLTTALAILVLSFSTFGQVIFLGPTTVMDGGTNNVAALTTNTVSLRIDVPRASDFVVKVQAKPILTNTVALVFYLQRSLDGNTWDSLSPTTITLTGSTNSTSPTSVSLISTISSPAVPYWFI